MANVVCIVFEASTRHCHAVPRPVPQVLVLADGVEAGDLVLLQPLLHLLHGGPHVNEDVGRLQDVQLLLLLLVLVETEHVLQLVSHGVGGLH